VTALLLAVVAQALPTWQPLFDGKTKQGWRDSAFERRAEVRVENGALLLDHGQPLTGVVYTGEFPKSNYEIRYEAAKLKGGDFFASLTFPVKDSFATLVVGGWGGDIVGLSSIDGWDASENETRAYRNFETGRWYAFRVEVTDARIRAWIDGEPLFGVAIEGREIGLRPGPIVLSKPLGFASYNTRGAIRRIEYRTLPAGPPTR